MEEKKMRVAIGLYLTNVLGRARHGELRGGPKTRVAGGVTLQSTSKLPIVGPGRGLSLDRGFTAML